MRTCKYCGTPNGEEDFLPGYARCKLCRRKMHKIWRDSHPDNMLKYKNDAVKRIDTSLRGFLSHLLGCAKNRSPICDITLDDLCELHEQQNGRCAISGVQMEIGQSKMGKGNPKPYGLSLDRIVASKGYVKGNVRLACHWANVMRYSRTDQELVDMCKRIIDYSANGAP